MSFQAWEIFLQTLTKNVKNELIKSNKQTKKKSFEIYLKVKKNLTKVGTVSYVETIRTDVYYSKFTDFILSSLLCFFSHKSSSYFTFPVR